MDWRGVRVVAYPLTPALAEATLASLKKNRDGLERTTNYWIEAK